MASCIVHLDNPQGQYAPGDVISGKIVCSFNSDTKIRGVKAILQGKEHTEWKKQEATYEAGSNQPNYRTTQFSGDNKVLEVVHTLTGECKHPAGRHEYPFTFNLPKNIPGTFQSSRGWIKYSIKGKIVIPFGFDKQDVKGLNVLPHANLHEISGVQMAPVTHRTEKNIGWFKTRLITLKLSLDRNGFNKGESFRARLDLTNMSTENITKVEVKIISKIESKTTYPHKDHKTDPEILAAVADTGVGAHGQRTYTFDLVVPTSAILNNFVISKLFKQTSTIEVTAHVSGLNSNIQLSAPVYFGTPPFSNVVHFPTNAQFPPNGYPQQTYVSPTFYPPPGPQQPPYGFTASQPQGMTREPPPPYSVHPPPCNNPPQQFYPSAPQMTTGFAPQTNTPNVGIAKEKEKEDDGFILL